MEFNRSFKDLNKEYGSYTLNFISSFIQYFPKVALDLTFVQRNFFFQFQHLGTSEESESFQTIVYGFSWFDRSSSFSSSFSSHVLLQVSRRNQVLSKHFAWKSPQLEHPVYQAHFLVSILSQVEITANICPLLQLQDFSSHSFKSSLSVSTKFKIL